MSTNVSSMNLSYDPYLAQRLNAAVNAAKAGNVPGYMQQMPQATAPQTSPTVAAAVSDETLKEYEKQITQIAKMQEKAMKEGIDAGNGQIIKSNGYVVTDGKDDGKIGFGKTMKNLGIGVKKWFTNLYRDENGNISLKQIGKTALGAITCVAIACIPGGLAVLTYAGLISGAAGVLKGVCDASTATTDQAKEQAFQRIGTNAVTTTMSALAIKGQSGFKGLNEQISGAWNQLLGKNASGVTRKAFLHEFRDNASCKVFGQKWTDVSSGCKSFGDYLKAAGEHFMSPVNKYINKGTIVEDSQAALNTKIAKLEESLASVTDEVQKNHIKDEISILRSRLSAYDCTAERIDISRTNINAKINELNTELSNKTNALSTAAEEAKNSLQGQIADLNRKISEKQAYLDELQKVENVANDNTLRLIWNRRQLNNQAFNEKHPSRLGRPFVRMWDTVKGAYEFTQSHPGKAQVINSISDFNTMLTGDSRMATFAPEEAAAVTEQYLAQLESQKSALEQEYMALQQQAQAQISAQASATQSAGISGGYPQGSASQILQNWANQYRV